MRKENIKEASFIESSVSLHVNRFDWVVTRWDPNKSGNRERTETEWLVLGLG